MMPAQEDVDIISDRGVRANSQNGPLFPVMYRWKSIGADTDFIVGVTLQELFLSAIKPGGTLPPEILDAHLD
jgi:hypothetical protein